MKKFTHIAIVAAVAMLISACAVETESVSGVEEVYSAEILAPTSETSLTVSELKSLHEDAPQFKLYEKTYVEIQASIEAGEIDEFVYSGTYVWLSIDAEEYGIDTSVFGSSQGYLVDPTTGLRVNYLGDNLWLLCEVIRADMEAEAGYFDTTITPVRYHFYPDTDELYTYKSTYATQERFVTYQKKDASGKSAVEFVNEEITDFITGATYDHLRLDRYFEKDGQEFHLMVYSQIFDEVVDGDTTLFAMTDPNGIIIIRKVGDDGKDIMDELLYAPSNEISYTMERNFLDTEFDYTGFD